MHQSYWPVHVFTRTTNSALFSVHFTTVYADIMDCYWDWYSLPGVYMYNLLNQTYIMTTVLKFSTNTPIYIFKKNITSHSYTNQVIAVHCTNIQTKLTTLFAVKITQLNTVNIQTTTARELVMFRDSIKSLRNEWMNSSHVVPCCQQLIRKKLIHNNKFMSRGTNLSLQYWSCRLRHHAVCQKLICTWGKPASILMVE